MRRGAGPPPGVAEPPPPCAPLSSNGKTTRPAGGGLVCAIFFTAATEQSRVCPAAVTHHSQEATVGYNDVIGQETPWLTERFIYSDLNYSIDLIVSSFELFERPFRSVAVGLTCSVAYTHRLWKYVNIFLTFAAFIHPI